MDWLQGTLPQNPMIPWENRIWVLSGLTECREQHHIERHTDADLWTFGALHADSGTVRWHGSKLGDFPHENWSYHELSRKIWRYHKIWWLSLELRRSEKYGSWLQRLGSMTQSGKGRLGNFNQTWRWRIPHFLRSHEKSMINHGALSCVQDGFCEDIGYQGIRTSVPRRWIRGCKRGSVSPGTWDQGQLPKFNTGFVEKVNPINKESEKLKFFCHKTDSFIMQAEIHSTQVRCGLAAQALGISMGAHSSSASQVAPGGELWQVSRRIHQKYGTS